MIYTFEQIQNIPKTAGVYSIVNILNGDRYNGYMWSHKKADKILPYKKDNAKRIKCQKLDDFGNVLEEFDSFKDAALSLGKKPHSGDQISLCARGKYNKMYGFKWRIKNDK